MSEKNSIELFCSLFKNYGYDVQISSDKTRVSGRKESVSDSGERLVKSIYYYLSKNFYKSSPTDDRKREIQDTAPCLTMYASGSKLLNLGIANLELRSIKYPHSEDIEKLEDYLECLLILLK